MNKRWKHVRLSITAPFVLAPAIVLMAHDAGGALKARAADPPAAAKQTAAADEKAIRATADELVNGAGTRETPRRSVRNGRSMRSTLTNSASCTAAGPRSKTITRNC